MTEFRSPVLLPVIPDDLSIPQFILHEPSYARPLRPKNAPFFIDDASGRCITDKQASYRTIGLANALSIKWGIGPQDLVCIFSTNHIGRAPFYSLIDKLNIFASKDYATVVWAVHILGGIITPANPSFAVEELKYQLALTRPKLIAVNSACLQTALSAAHACGLSDDAIFLIDSVLSNLENLEQLVRFGSSKANNYKAVTYKPGEGRTTIAFLCFSSGTTGKPKAVAVSHYAVIANVIQTATHQRLNDPSLLIKSVTPGDVCLGVLPFFHIYGLVVVMHYILYSGASVVVVPKFNFSTFLESITKHKVTHLYLVPPQIVLLCKHLGRSSGDYSHVKFCLSGAAPLSGQLINQMTKLFPNAVIGQGYGLTETVATVSTLPHHRKVAAVGSAGEIIPGVVAKLVKSDGSLAEEGEPGELWVKGPAMAMGYYENPTATAEVFVDGWVRTGDQVIIRNLEIYVVDRLKEIMKVRGFQVAPAELEGHLLLHPDVVDACVVGIPDEYSGEVPLAYIVPRADALKEGEANLKRSIQKFVSDSKAHYKHLAGGVEFIAAIPKNPSGKILRRILGEKAKESNKSSSKL